MYNEDRGHLEVASALAHSHGSSAVPQSRIVLRQLHPCTGLRRRPSEGST